MVGLVNILVILAVVALIARRQFQARKIDTERRFWLLPLILGALALRDPHLIDPAHKTAAIALLAGSVVVVLAMGSVWGWTVRLWHERDGSIWAKGTAATVAAWAGLIAMRVGLYGLGSALHIHQSSNALLLTLGVLLLTRGVVVNWRARALDAPHSLRAVA
ncbi:CcdC protein domain-containing protein [Kitasatospora azatica]|uniref:CcdC protein domain-containing protein n=1 Tax=Kitasatospora azatica TaxID=58347 RepID=UPI00069101FE|nr:CcdC protein domain-containing protein [Kitasatospora azatica]